MVSGEWRQGILIAFGFAGSSPHPLACGETLPPQVEKGKRPCPTPSFSTLHDLRSTIIFFYTPHATRFPDYSPRFATVGPYMLGMILNRGFLCTEQ